MFFPQLLCFKDIIIECLRYPLMSFYSLKAYFLMSLSISNEPSLHIQALERVLANQMDSIMTKHGHVMI